MASKLAQTSHEGMVPSPNTDLNKGGLSDAASTQGEITKNFYNPEGASTGNDNTKDGELGVRRTAKRTITETSLFHAPELRQPDPPRASSPFSRKETELQAPRQPRSQSSQDNSVPGWRIDKTAMMPDTAPLVRNDRLQEKGDDSTWNDLLNSDGYAYLRQVLKWSADDATRDNLSLHSNQPGLPDAQSPSTQKNILPVQKSENDPAHTIPGNLPAAKSDGKDTDPSAKSEFVSAQEPVSDPNFTNVVSSGQVEQKVDTGMSTDAAPVDELWMSRLLNSDIDADEWFSVVRMIKTKKETIQTPDAGKSLARSIPVEEKEVSIVAEPEADPTSTKVTSSGQMGQRVDTGMSTNAGLSGSLNPELPFSSWRSEDKTPTPAHLLMSNLSSSTLKQNIDGDGQKPDPDGIDVEGAGILPNINKDQTQRFGQPSDDENAPSAIESTQEEGQDIFSPLLELVKEFEKEGEEVVAARIHKVVRKVRTTRIIEEPEKGEEVRTPLSNVELKALKGSALSEVPEVIGQVRPRTWREFLQAKADDPTRAWESLSERINTAHEAVAGKHEQLTKMLREFGEGLEQGKLEPEFLFQSRFPNAVERGKEELKELGAKIQKHADTLGEIMEDLKNLKNEVQGADPDSERYQDIYDRYQEIYRRAAGFKKELREDQDSIIQAGFSKVNRWHLKHANAWYGIVIVSVIVSALNAIYPSILKSEKDGKAEVDVGAFFGGLAAGIAGNTILSKIKLFPANAIFQTVAGQTLVISGGYLVSSLENKNG